MTPETEQPKLSGAATGEPAKTVAINGVKRRIGPRMTVSALLEELELPEDRVAVELDGEILRRPKWAATEPSDGARLEIVHFVGGG